MRRTRSLLIPFCLGAACLPIVGASDRVGGKQGSSAAPFVVVLGIAQDAGVPQAGSKRHPAWEDAGRRRLASCLGVVDPGSGERWMIEATPDFKAQLHRLDLVAPNPGIPGLAGVLLTHAHMGHYTGLLHLGHEAIGASGVPVYAMPRLAEYLRTNGPWDQLVRYGNIELRLLADGRPLALNERIEVTAFRVPHREEYSEVVGFRVRGPRRSVLFLPDIDKWEEWDAWGTRVEEVLATVDVAYLDATFFDGEELPGRDMAAIPHPFVVESLERFSRLPYLERAKIRFIHLNHSNPALEPESEAARAIAAAGARVAVEGERFSL